MNGNEIAVYALVAVAALALGYILAGAIGLPAAANPGGNSTVSLGNGTSTGAYITAPADRIAKLQGALEAYISVQFGADSTLTFNNAVDKGEFVMLNFTDDTGMPIMIPVSRDFQYMYGSAVEIDEFADQIAALQAQMAAQNDSGGGEEPPVEMQKSDRPTMEVFVMSYCPYGVQMEKAVIPVQQLLGNKTDISIKFVNYILHGAKETQENTRQYCINKTDPSKFWGYLECFAGNGNSSVCMANMSIDEPAINSCMADAYAQFGITDSGTSFPIYSAENSLYGVRGSPTVVINGVVTSMTRSPEEVKKALCAAFNTPPAECSVVLSTTSASAGFGYSAGSGSSGGCGA